MAPKRWFAYSDKVIVLIHISHFVIIYYFVERCASVNSSESLIDYSKGSQTRIIASLLEDQTRLRPRDLRFCLLVGYYIDYILTNMKHSSVIYSNF